MRHLLFVCAVAAPLALVACGSSATPPPPAAAAPAGKSVDPATAGTITGRVAFEGKRPAVDTIPVTADPACVAVDGPSIKSDAVLIAPDGALQNVFVFVKDDFTGYTFPVPTNTVVLDQRGCRYVPHVVGIRVGQPLEILNSDDTLHNVHAMPMENQEFNRAETMKGASMTTTFTVPEQMIPFKCNVHSWMTAYVGVMAHPFFAVTGADGSFAIKGLPPGTYTLEAWHEKFGTQTQPVTIGPGASQTVSFTFTAAAK